MLLSDRLIRTAWQAAAAAKRTLPEPCLERLRRSAGLAIDRVRLVEPELSAQLTRAAGVPAFEAGGAVFLHPLVRPDDPGMLALVAHEAAHALQRRQRPAAGAVPWETERDADGLSRAVQLGLPWQPSRGAPCGPLQPGVPAIFLLLAAAGVLTGVGGYVAYKDRQEREAQGLDPLPPELHETAWGFVPFVGSLDQVLNGQNAWSQAGGAVFLVLDCTAIGGLVAKGLTRGGVMFATRTGVQEGLALAARGGGTASQRAAYANLTKAAAAGEIHLGARAGVEQQLMAWIRSTPGPVIIAGSTGWRNHSVTYLIRNGKIWKLHGGISRFAFKVEGREAATLGATWMRQFNRVSVYGGTGLVSDLALSRQVAFWRRYQGFLADRAANWWAWGCADSQAVLLERLGLLEAPLGSRFIPHLLDRARARGPYGYHFVVNSTRGLPGSAIHLSTILTALSGYGLGRGQAMPWREELLRMFMNWQFRHNVGRGEMDAALMEPVPALDLEGDSGADTFSVGWPQEQTVEDADPEAIHIRLPERLRGR